MADLMVGWKVAMRVAMKAAMMVAHSAVQWVVSKVLMLAEYLVDTKAGHLAA